MSAAITRNGPVFALPFEPLGVSVGFGLDVEATVDAAGALGDPLGAVERAAPMSLAISGA